MKLLYKLERKLGRYAIPNLMRYIVILFGIGLVVGTFMPGFYYEYLSLDFAAIMRGQVWRLVTFIIPLSSLNNILFFAISTFFYYLIGNDLEQHWGAFRMNLYFFSGVFFNLIANLITFIMIGESNPTSAALGLICKTLFFAYAALYPNSLIYVYFLIPIKAKYWAILGALMYVYQMYVYFASGMAILVIPMLVAFANFLIFFFMTRNYHNISPGEFKRKANFIRQMNDVRNHGTVTQFQGRNVVTRHKCAVCGRTELDGDQLEFRFCSKCDGNYEYCTDHLFTHEHVKKQ